MHFSIYFTPTCYKENITHMFNSIFFKLRVIQLLKSSSMSGKFFGLHKAFLLPLNKQVVFCQHRTELEQGQIEFGSKLRAHKFE